MRFILRVLSGAAGMLAGWWVTGMLVINMTEPRDIGDVFEAFVIIAPIGGLVGLVVGVWLFTKLGVARGPASPPVTDSTEIQ